MFRLMAAATGALRASTDRCSTRLACASTARSTGTARRCCCNRAPSTRPVTYSQARTRCVKFAASIRSTTTTAFRPGPSKATGRSRMSRSARVAALLLVVLAAPALAQDKPRNFGIGHVATQEQIAGWDIDVRPDGQGAPPGHGSVKQGEKVYLDRCASCHGVFGYIRRAMPFGDAQSLSNDELYAVTAYVLNLNEIVDDKFVLSKETWGRVKMPNENGFYDDDREKTEKAFWNANPCMRDCRGPVTITGRALAVDVTPDDKTQKRGVE